MRRYVLAVASAALLILVAAPVWRSGSIRLLKPGREPEHDLAMTPAPGPEGKRVDSAAQYLTDSDDTRALQLQDRASLPGSEPAARLAKARRTAEILAQAAMRVSSGDIAGARAMLVAAEERGQGPVTFALAETYDPNVLATWGARGVSPDVTRAEALYRKALKLGMRRAHLRLEALDASSSSARTPIVASDVAIKVTTPLLAEPASRVRLPIEIGPPEAIQKNSFVRIRGLPPTATLSEGHAIAPGAWAVPLVALPTLTVILPADLHGQSDVAISLVSIDGGLLAEARTQLVIAAPPAHAMPAAPPGNAAEEAQPLYLQFRD